MGGPRVIGRLARIGAAAALGACALTAASAPNPAGACACGIALEASVATERALVIEGEDTERIILSLDLAAEGDRPAVVLPVPGEPEVEAVAGGDPLAYLDVATAPPPEVATGSGEGDTAAAPPDVDVIGRETVGGYDVSRLAAGDPQALSQWLDSNGYTLPQGAEPILGEYIDEGWSFVAIRLAPGGDGRLKPLDVEFETEELVYPMRLSQLGTEPLALTLYALADAERSVEGLETTWTGAVAELDPQPPPELETLFAAGDHVTRMEAEFTTPSALTSDFELVAAAPQGESEPAAELFADEVPDDDESEPTLAVVAVALGAVALLCVAVAWRARRM